MRVHVLRLGHVDLKQGSITPGYRDDQPMTLPIMAYLVGLDAGQWMLIDTGMHADHGRATVQRPTSARVKELRVRMQPGDTMVERMYALGLAPRDISVVINTHLHFDHAGNNGLFPHARFVVQRRHYDHAVANDVFPNEYWNLPHLKYDLIDGEAEIAAGVKVIPSDGHAVGHQSVLLSLSRDPSMLICGDAIFCRDQLTHGTWGSHTAPEAAKASASRLVAIAEGCGAEMVFGHDPEQGRSLRQSAHFYS